MVRRLPAEFVRLLERQHGVFSVSQAMSHGLTEDQVRAHVDGRRWRPSARGVYVGFTGPLHERHLEWTAVLLGGDHAMLSHETAAHHHGLVPERPTAVHVLVPHDDGRNVVTDSCSTARGRHG